MRSQLTVIRNLLVPLERKCALVAKNINLAGKGKRSSITKLSILLRSITYFCSQDGRAAIMFDSVFKP